MKKFIVIDGLDGSGKDTQANLLVSKFKDNGEKVLLRSHPNKDNKYGRLSKKALLGRGKINHLKATVYYGMDVIRSLKKYYNNSDIDILIFSRYTLAVMYLPNFINIIIYKIVCILLPVSEYMIFIDVSPEESLKRLKKRDEEKEMFENKKELIKARNKSKKVTYNWHVLNGNKKSEEIHKDILDICFKN